MTETCYNLASAICGEIAAALRAIALAPPITAIGLQRFAGKLCCGAVAGELQQMIEQGFTPHQLALLLELIAKDRSQRPTLGRRDRPGIPQARRPSV